jgi:hypothetical protein
MKPFVVAAAMLMVVGVAALFAIAAIASPSVRKTDAYRAAGMTTSGSDRTLLANAAVEGDPPPGFMPGPRLRQPGTLARLRYETFDAAGARLDSWDVRALVPPVPAPDSSDRAVEYRCPSECQAELAGGAVLVSRSGDPGIPAEWVLRMPLNQPLDLGRRPLTTQDILDDRTLRISSRQVTRGGVEGVEPSRIMVTLVEECAARVQAAGVTRLEFFPDAILPIPRGFRTYRWTQLEGCGRLTPLPPPPQPPPAPAAALPPPPPDLRSVVLRRDTGTGFTVLNVDDSWFALHPKPVEFVLRDVCRYDAGTDLWTTVSMPHPPVPVRIERRSDTTSAPRIVLRLPEETALFYVRWVEREAGERSARMQSVRDTLATSGPVLCNDIELGRGELPNRVPACIPFANRAEARFVPDPCTSCGR